MTITTSPSFRLRALLFLLLLLGAGISCVALYEHVVYSSGLATGPSFCNISERINCEAVNASEWSTVFGIPIASYGIFFYLTLAVLLLVASVSTVISSQTAGAVVLVGGAVASILSVALFALSEFVIGALCLLCLGLYVINFLLLGLTWRCAFRGALWSGIGEGIRALLAYPKIVVCGGAGSLLARVSFAALAVLGALCVYLPEATYEVVAGIQEAREAEQIRDPVSAWRAEPQILIESKVGGAFGDYAQGDPSAPIQIVEFADFECPGCRHMYTALHSVLSRYEGKYYFVFRNYPLDQACNPGIKSEFHQYACVAAMFTRCAGEQGKFWEALDLVFTDPLLAGEEPVAKVRDALVTRAAESLSLDRDGVVECLTSGRYLSKIQSDIAAGNAAGLEGTPALWINGKAVGRPSVEAVEKIFNSILQSGK
jgi:protein-disulfide isomerase/uncharacterized membrane protein